jgi:hypothetical protein
MTATSTVNKVLNASIQRVSSNCRRHLNEANQFSDGFST